MVDIVQETVEVVLPEKIVFFKNADLVAHLATKTGLNVEAAIAPVHHTARGVVMLKPTELTAAKLEDYDMATPELALAAVENVIEQYIGANNVEKSLFLLSMTYAGVKIDEDGEPVVLYNLRAAHE